MPNPRLYPQNPLFSIEGLFMILDASWSPRYLSSPDLFLKLQTFFFFQLRTLISIWLPNRHLKCNTFRFTLFISEFPTDFLSP